jgi:hypothetical protein
MKSKFGDAELLHLPTGEFHPAEIFLGIDQTNLEHLKRDWEPLFDPVFGAQDRKWNWEDMAARAAADPFMLSVLALEAGGSTQALMMLIKGGLKCKCKHPDHLNEDLMYVHLLASSPQNRPAKVTAPLYKGCGSVMLATAINLSASEGLSGRIALHSLAGAESFYRDYMNMTDLGPDSGYSGLRQFEFSNEGALPFIQPTATSTEGEDT